MDLYVPCAGNKFSWLTVFNMKFMQGYFQKKVDSLLSVGATELQ